MDKFQVPATDHYLGTVTSDHMNAVGEVSILNDLFSNHSSAIKTGAIDPLYKDRDSGLTLFRRHLLAFTPR